MKCTATGALVAASLAALAATSAVQAQEGTWEARFRVEELIPANKSDAIGALGLPADAIHVNKKTIPEVDFSYFFTNNIAAELILTYPQKQTVSIPSGDIGTFKHLPPTLLAQYHFLPATAVDPYVGVGINYTLISDVSLAVPGADLKRSSFGPAVQGGIDFAVDKNWVVNLDAKYIQIRTDLTDNGTTLGKVRVDPWLIGVGVGYKF
ncbi:MAG TPA: OmpW family outer membrane protein [Burkholderiaceae bacterium]|nr:OmpW family outer membrane protein [Burkholderiaceae bacterium]